MHANYNSVVHLGKLVVGAGHPPLVIAEISANHNHDLDRVMAMIEGAHRAGVRCIKLQTWSSDGMTLDLNEGAFVITDPASLWKGYTLHALYERARLPWEWHGPIFEKCRSLGIEVISTPFDEAAVDFLESLNVAFYKIASFENVDLKLIAKIAKTGKPIILSCGLANIRQIAEALECAKAHGAREIILLKCTSQYPASPKNVNLKTLPHMREAFGCLVGLSDHTAGIGVAVASVAYGAAVIEKHFNLQQSDQSLDDAFSIGVQEMQQLVEETTRAWEAQGEVVYGVTADEQSSLQYRRSLYIVNNIKKGEAFTHENVRAIRPGFGMSPKYLEMIIGRRANCDLKRGEPLAWDKVGDVNAYVAEDSVSLC